MKRMIVLIMAAVGLSTALQSAKAYAYAHDASRGPDAVQPAEATRGSVSPPSADRALNLLIDGQAVLGLTMVGAGFVSLALNRRQPAPPADWEDGLERTSYPF